MISNENTQEMVFQNYALPAGFLSKKHPTVQYACGALLFNHRLYSEHRPSRGTGLWTSALLTLCQKLLRK